MATLQVGGQYTISASPVQLTTALGLKEGVWLRTLSIKNAKNAANILYVGKGNVAATPANAHVELDAGESYDFYSGIGSMINTDEIYLVGTANAANIAFITGAF